MPINRIMVIIAAILVVFDVIWFLIRGKKGGFADKESLNRGLIARIIAIYVFGIVLIGLIWFVEFGPLADVVLCGCGVFGIEIANKDLLPRADD